jgi:hypothetical protein
MQRAAATSESKPTNILAPFSVISSTKNFFPRDTMRNAFMQRIWRRGSAVQCVEAPPSAAVHSAGYGSPVLPPPRCGPWR